MAILSNRSATGGGEVFFYQARIASSWVPMPATHAQRAIHRPYNGVLGVLPDWFAERDRCEFLRLRNKLLDFVWPASADKPKRRVKPIVVKQWIDAYRTAGEREGRSGSWPSEFTEEIAFLAQMYYAHTLGEERGQRFLYGDEQARTLHAPRKAGRRSAEQRRRNSEFLRAEIARIEQRLQPRERSNKRISLELEKLASPIFKSPEAVRKLRTRALKKRTGTR